MSHSLALTKDGDLDVRASVVQLVSGENKVKQDIFTWITEAYNVDRFHPEYGSTVSSYIGEQNSALNAFEIEIEVTRVLGNLMRYQRAQIANNPEKFSLSEIIDDIVSVRTKREIDSLTIFISYRLASNPDIIETTEVGIR